MDFTRLFAVVLAGLIKLFLHGLVVWLLWNALFTDSSIIGIELPRLSYLGGCGLWMLADTLFNTRNMEAE
jgi:hypothetical protein